MRELFLLLAIPGSLIWGLTGHRRAMIVLMWVCFMRPYDFSYGFWKTIPLFKLALGVALVSSLLHGKFKPKFDPFLLLFLGFFAWMLASGVMGFDPSNSWFFYKSFFLTFWIVAPAVFFMMDSLQTLKWCIGTAAGSLLILGAKVGLGLGLKGGGHITEQIDGFVGDNNGFGLVLVVAIAIAVGMRKAITIKWTQFLFWPLVGLAILCVVFTKSRGAFLSTGLIFLIGAGISKNPIRNVGLLVAISLLAFYAIPSDFFSRMETFQNIEEDSSAMSRIFFWKLSWLQALNHPVFGVGPDNFMNYTEAFYSAELGSSTNHVAHSTYFQVLGETGFVGLFIYFVLITWTGISLQIAVVKTKNMANQYPDLAWVNSTAFWLRIGFLGYLFGSAFLNMLVLDFPWYIIWFSNMLWPLTRKELNRRKKLAQFQMINQERIP